MPLDGVGICEAVVVVERLANFGYAWIVAQELQEECHVLAHVYAGNEYRVAILDVVAPNEFIPAASENTAVA